METQGHFVVDEVSPVKAAARLSIPVLLIHGAEDHETAPARPYVQPMAQAWFVGGWRADQAQRGL
jgi:pimeloyl-ACP methyl ester carboxylesterase